MMNIFAKQDKLVTHAPRIISALFVIASVYTLYTGYNRMTDTGAPGHPGTRSSSGGQAGEKITPATIASWHLFGKSTAGAPVSEPSPVSAPDTRLNLKLYGVIASDGQYDAGAIIEDGKHTQKYYAIGDNVQPGVKLKEIYPDRVIIERSGRLETLRLPEQGVSLDSPGTSGENTITPVIPKPEQQKSLMELRERLLKQQKKLQSNIPTDK